MKKIFILLFLANVSLSFAQTRYLIYFKDKGIQPLEKISEASQVYNTTLRTLSERAIERRKKVMGDGIIRFEDVPINVKYIETIENLNIKIINKLKWFNAVSALLDNNQLDEVKRLSFVDKIEKVQTFILKDKTETENSPGNLKKEIKVSSSIDYGPSDDQLALSHIPVVHSAGITGNGIIIGLLDSGFRWRTHESLKNATVLAEHDFVFNDDTTANQANDKSTQDGHGTFVFSIIGGNKQGQIIGSAFGAQFILAKTEDLRSETHVEEDNYAAGLEWMENLGVDITSSSLGYNEFDKGQTSYTYKDMDGKTTIVTKAANLAFERGVVTVQSAGNEGSTAWQYILAPADAFNMIAVGAVADDNKIASFSSRGPTYDRRIKPDVVAQGLSIYGAVASDPVGYHYSQGTSFACPIVSGITGLLLSAYPFLTNKQVFNIVHMSGDTWAAPDTVRGYGLLLADRAIEYPNIEELNGNFILHKSFLDTLIQPSTVKVYLSADESNYTSMDLLHDNGVFYKIGLSGFNNGQKIKLYFTYTDSNNQQKRSPDNGFYELEYGNKDISTSIEKSGNITPAGYTLYQNYPNPFNSSTVIKFYSPAKSTAELTIYNLLGQQIKQYNITVEAGNNFVNWDGANGSGITNSSGVYFYVLKIAGNTYTKKMILLR